MQTAIDQLTAKQVHEDPRRPEEHERAHDKSIVDERVDDAVLIEVFPLAPGRRNQRQNR